MGTLGNLLHELNTTAKRRAEQAKRVFDLREPERTLAELEAEEQRLATEIAQKQARLDQAAAELWDAERDIARREPREDKYHAAIEVLDELADDAMRGFTLHIDPYRLAQDAVQIRAEIELLARARAARERLTAEIRALKRDLGVK
jgi:hypothetical protein